MSTSHPTTRATSVAAAHLTLAEKASLTSGADYWNTKSIDRVGLPAVTMTDGPHGIRKSDAGDHLGLSYSRPATCFPPAVALGSSWDPELAERIGHALAKEAIAQGIGILLGPGINIKRSPLCGRNFEYFSEDPLVSGVLGSALVRGIQSRGVGTSLKHFAANNQETDRMRMSSDIDPRPLREIYLRAFERVVRDEQPWTVMCSYNRINGVYASEDPWLLTQVLRDEWGFGGLVVSDWGAVDDRVAALRAGLDLQMPAGGGADADVVDAVRDGSLDESLLDTAADRVLSLVAKAARGSAADGGLDEQAHHDLARAAAASSIVLLKNEDELLPLRTDQSIAVIGAFARTPRFQGAGSSLVNATKVDNALDQIRRRAGRATYDEGFPLTADPLAEDLRLLREQAVAAARSADVAVVFAGLPPQAESEGIDRTHIDLPVEQLALIDAVVEANPRTVVVLSNGAVVALPFADRVPAIVEGWLLGQAGGAATADVLFGDVNPSGKLTETIPTRLEDTPAFLDFPGDFSRVRYGEGIFVGYRWYEARRIPVSFPFGHGLSYTTFSYGEASAVVDDTGDIRITVPVTNTGDRAGREVVQVYTALPGSAVARPPHELRGFADVDLQPEQTREVTIDIRRSDLAYWDIRIDRWVVEGGDYSFEVAASSQDIRASAVVTITGDSFDVPLTRHSTLGEAFRHPVAGPLLQDSIANTASDEIDANDEAMRQMTESLPLGRLPSLSNGATGVEDIEQLLLAANA